MNRYRLPRVCLAMALGWVTLGSGCRLLDRQGKDQSTAKVDGEPTSEADKYILDELKSDTLSKAHTPGRSAGAWSSEAREIEGHFNVR